MLLKSTTPTTNLAMVVVLIGGTFLMMAHPSSSFSPSLQQSRRIHEPTTSATMSLQQDTNRFSLAAEDSKTSAASVVAPQAKKKSSLPTAVLSAALMLGIILSPPAPILSSLVAPAHAVESKVVGALKGSGLVFKDTLQIERFEDPKVQGVVLYISNFDRPITEKIGGGNFFNDPSYASVACARTGDKIAIADNIAKGTGGEEVFEESRSLLFKTLRVQRVYDEEKKTVVYVSITRDWTREMTQTKAVSSRPCVPSI